MTPGWWQRAFPGDPRHLHDVRRYVGDLLADLPERDDVISCVAELASNAIVHTRSGKGGRFVVHVRRACTLLRVAVADEGSCTVPVIRPFHRGDLLEGGRGLAIVARLSDCLGIEGDERGRTVWAEFRLTEKPPSMLDTALTSARCALAMGSVTESNRCYGRAYMALPWS